MLSLLRIRLLRRRWCNDENKTSPEKDNDEMIRKTFHSLSNGCLEKTLNVFEEHLFLFSSYEKRMLEKKNTHVVWENERTSSSSAPSEAV